MKKLRPVIAELKPSLNLEGEVGVFSTQIIKKDSVIFPISAYEEIFHNWNEFSNMDKATKTKVMNFCIGNERGFYAPSDLNLLSTAWYMNHSCAPNVGFDKKSNFVAMRNIRKGEELLWDYSYDETNPKFTFKCSCKSKSCRETVSGNDWMNYKKLKFKIKYLSPYLQSLIKKQNPAI